MFSVFLKDGSLPVSGRKKYVRYCLSGLSVEPLNPETTGHNGELNLWIFGWYAVGEWGIWVFGLSLGVRNC